MSTNVTHEEALPWMEETAKYYIKVLSIIQGEIVDLGRKYPNDSNIKKLHNFIARETYGQIKN